MSAHVLTATPARDTGKLDAGPDLFVVSCSCGQYRSGVRTERQAMQDGQRHVAAKTDEEHLPRRAIEVLVRANLDAFTEEMRAQNIHVGVNGICAVDGQPWPCDHSDPQ